MLIYCAHSVPIFGLDAVKCQAHDKSILTSVKKGTSDSVDKLALLSNL